MSTLSCLEGAWTATPTVGKMSIWILFASWLTNTNMSSKISTTSGKKQVQQEFGYSREEASLIARRPERQAGHEGPGRLPAGWDKLVTDELLRPTNFDELQFAQQLQKQ